MNKSRFSLTSLLEYQLDKFENEYKIGFITIITIPNFRSKTR